MDKVKWGVIGGSNFARTRTIPAMLQAPSVDLVGIASRSRDKAEEFRAQFKLQRAYSSYDELVDDPDIQAVYIPLPNGLHGEWIVKAAERGKHVITEKPFTADAAEAERVAAAVRKAGIKMMEAFMWRFHPQHERARMAVRNGEIGTVRLVRAAFTFTIAREPNVRLNADLAGGSVMDVGCYPVSGARYYFDEEPTIAFARGEIDPEYRVDMSMAGVLQFPTGLAVVDSGFHVPYRTDLEIVGDKGTIHIPQAWLPADAATIIINGKPETLPSSHQYVTEFEHFSQCILNNTEPRFGPDDAVKQMRAVDAIRRSIASGQPEHV